MAQVFSVCSHCAVDVTLNSPFSSQLSPGDSRSPCDSIDCFGRDQCLRARGDKALVSYLVETPHWRVEVPLI